MGYTHYWQLPTKTISNSKWQEVIQKVSKLLNNYPNFLKEKNIDFFSIHGGLGEEEPIINSNEIILNGNAFQDQDFETFSFYKDQQNLFNFCKTGRRPYDLIVTTILLILHNIANVKIESDGGKEDWEIAEELYKYLFPYSLINNPIK